ncbi:4'-phosphopantetheinyl transferase family protein [Oerskovia sp. NPDC060338]|uniref:4'-phosphopantetheinyl transferase family protein n=1 Tax=Oerskovia sp. NPDC060338 TaxID=3347100 RepID=UPI003652BB33
MPTPLLTAAVTVWCAAPDATGARATEWLSPDEALRAAAFRHEEDRQQFVTGRALVRAALGERLGVPPTEVAVRLDPRDAAAPGRPFVEGAPSFSIAHAGDWVLVAVVETVTGSRGVAGDASSDGDLDLAVGVDVGVDVESTAPARDHLTDLLDAVPPGERPADGWDAASFTRSWTRREAVLKAVGTGLLAPRDDLLLSPADRAAAVVRSGGAVPAPDRLALRDLTLPSVPPDSWPTPRAGESVTLGGRAGQARRPGTSPSLGETYLGAVALCAPRGPVAFSTVDLADGRALLSRHRLGTP